LQFFLEYHWDCYDLKEVNGKSIGNNLGQVSVDEIRDAESNSDNSQIELSSEDLGGESCNKIIPSTTPTSIGHHHSLDHHNHLIRSAHSPSPTSDDPFEQGVTTTSDLPSSTSSGTDKSTSHTLLEKNLTTKHHPKFIKNDQSLNYSQLKKNLTDKEASDRKILSKDPPTKYLAHLNQYLPVYQKNCPAFLGNVDSCVMTKILPEGSSHPINDSSAKDNRGTTKQQSQQLFRRLSKDIRKKQERRSSSAFEVLRRYNESSDAKTIKSDSRRQSTIT